MITHSMEAMPMKSMLTYEETLVEGLRTLKLSRIELQQLREIVTSRSSLTGKYAKISHIYAQASAATGFIESLQERVIKESWEKVNKAATRARKARR
jgi:hypothetical protein